MIEWRITEMQSPDGRLRITKSQEEFCLLVRGNVTSPSASISWHPTLAAAKAAAEKLEPNESNGKPCARCGGLGEYDLRIETLGDTVRAVCCDCRPVAGAVG